MKMSSLNITDGYTLSFGVKGNLTVYPVSIFLWQQLKGLAGMNGYNFPDQPVSLQGNEALRFADALLDGLEDVPDHDALKEKKEWVVFPDGVEGPGFAQDTDISPIEWFSYDKGQEWLRGLILHIYRHRGFALKEA